MYIILGATGNTGSIIANTLLANKQNVRVVGRSAIKLRSFVSKGAEAFVADLTDAEALTRAFTGARAAYVLIPPDLSSTDYRAYQHRVSDAIRAAIERAGVPYAVTLSSIGADKKEGTGPVVGLYELEQKLNAVSGLNVVHLRAGYFMENLLPQVGVINGFGIIGAPLPGDLRLAMIATKDIGAAAAEALLKLDFSGKQTRELQGQRDVSYNEVTRIIGKAIGKPDLSFVQLPPEQFRSAVQQSGISANVADLILEMCGAMISGHMKALEPRAARNTTPTSIETLVKDTFLPAYQGKAVSA